MYQEIVVNLAIVLCCIFVYFILVYWFKRHKTSKSDKIGLMASFPLSSKEKIVSIKWGRRRLLLGVTQHQISLLSSYKIKKKYINNLDSIDSEEISEEDFINQLKSLSGKVS